MREIYIKEADTTGTSSNTGIGHWNNKGVVCQHMGTLPREKLVDFYDRARSGNFDVPLNWIQPFDYKKNKG